MVQDAELPFSTLLWQPRSATWLVTIVCKATFSIQPDELGFAKAQEPVTQHDSFRDDDPTRSLSAATDLVPLKPLADVVVVGSAWAAGRPVRALAARLVFESIDKSIEIVADRSVGSDGTVYQGQRFNRMPLVYERSAGGPGTWNPVGVGPGSRDAQGRAPLPNITPLGKGDMTMSMPEPIGFGPIAPTWPQRADKRGARGWQNQPMAEGFDAAYFNVAPPDQQVEGIAADAPILLEGLHARHGVLAAKLPGISPRVIVERAGGKERPEMRADTLVVDTDREIVVVTWRGQFALEHQQETFRVSAHAERPRQSWRTAPHTVPQRSTIIDPAESTADDGPKTAAPFVRSPPGESTADDGPKTAAPFVRSPSRTANPSRASAAALPFQNIARASENRASSPTLPFAHAAAPPQPASPEPAPVHPPMLQTQQVPIPSFAQASAVPAPQMPAPMAAYAPAPVAPAPVFAPQHMEVAYAKPPADVWGPSGVAAIPVPPAVITHSSSAGFGGAVSASNAAADPSVVGGQANPYARRFEGDVLQLLWFMPEAARRVRRKPEWKKILDELPPAVFDPEVDDPSALDAEDLEETREVYEVIARGTPGGHESIDGALLDEVRTDGRFAAQLLLLRGEAHFEFDEIEVLKATISAAAPFTASDELLKKTIEEATTFLAAPGLVASPDVTNAVTAKLRDVFKSTTRPVPASYLDDQSERALLERRAYQKRSVFGEPHLRSLFFFGNSTTGIPAYFPVKVAEKLPMLRRVRVRALCEAHFQADQYEAHPAALRGAAVARIVR